MLRFLAITVLTLLGNAPGLIIASWTLDGFNLIVTGFTVRSNKAGDEIVS